MTTTAATALLAAGLLPPDEDLSGARVEDLLDRLRSRGEAAPSFLWTRLGAGRPSPATRRMGGGGLPLWRRPDRDPDAATTRRLEAAWSRLLAEQPGVVEAARVEVADVAAARTLQRLAQPDGPVVVSPVVRIPGRPRYRWHWPIRLRVLGPVDWIEELRTHRHLDEHFTVDEDGEAVDLLLVEAAGGLPQPHDQRIDAAAAVFVLGDASAEDLFATIAGAVSSPMVAAVPGHDVTWWDDVVPELGHDLPLDVVLRRLRPDAIVGGTGTAYDVTAVAHWATAFARSADGLAEVEGMVATESFDAGSAGAGRLAEMIRAVAPLAAVDVSLDPGPAPSSAPSSPTSAMPGPADVGSPPPAPPPVVEERRVHALIEHDDRPRNSFVRGAVNELRCWIGLPDAAAPMADRAIPALEIPEQGLDLTVELRWSGEPAVAPLLLPGDRDARSNDAVLRLAVPPDVESVEADLVLSYRGRFVEVVRLDAVAVPADQPDVTTPPSLTVQLARREVLDLPQAEPCTARLTYTGGVLGVYTGTGGRTFALDAPEEAMKRLGAELFATDKQLVRQRESQPGQEPVLDVTQEEVRVLLRDLARFGAGLHNQLEAQGLADLGDRIQLLTLDSGVIVPLEFVYDAGYPADAATLCDGWLGGALAPDASECPACAGTTVEGRFAPVICPLGFWALRTVIERWDPDMAGAASGPTPERQVLPPLDSAVFACSGKVTPEEQEATWEAIRSRISSATFARDWEEWHRAVKAHPRLLVALPHHGEGDLEDYLEIGDGLTAEQGRLLRSMIDAAYVNPDRLEPGPLLLLLGCTTATTTDLGYLQLVRTFERHRTSIVLGTLAQVLGRNAGPLARELVSQLVTPELPASDFGTVLRTVRRTMIRRGHMLALGVVALGDAEWRLAPAPAA